MVYDKVCDILAEQLNLTKEDIAPQSSLYDDLHFDSLELVETMVLIEHEFDIDMPDEDMPTMTTVQDIVAYIEENTDDE